MPMRMAEALWGYGIAHEPRAREFDLNGAARAGFDPATGDLEDWRVLDIDDEPLPEDDPRMLDALQPDETGRVIVLDSQGDYWERQGDGDWRQTDPQGPNTVSGLQATSEALTDWHAPLLRVTVRPTT
ncbi:hypothetical protein GZ998_03530 [Actinomyces sp. 594]|uniref:hypothetical protein n=1 Tax=Actinomyces sp. 594 TaxID=2057793 RepID=UPI001C579719|nr:hypothetical protein [Actinomyces sp. 594]MBW3068585.1 hypothetical protein [Actinomyces sp. 594]